MRRRKPWAGTPQAQRWSVSPQPGKRTRDLARTFRKAPTPSENILWQALRNRQLRGRKFKRQQPIGRFIVDFYCAEERLVIEIDGPIHTTRRQADLKRQRLIEELGMRFVRLSAKLVETDLDQALDHIARHFTAATHQR